FFFQAEDGIRDKLVTGVQTCALPICKTASEPDGAELLRGGLTREILRGAAKVLLGLGDVERHEELGRTVGLARGLAVVHVGREQIGRASCRERGWIAGGGGAGKKGGE